MNGHAIFHSSATHSGITSHELADVFWISLVQITNQQKMAPLMRSCVLLLLFVSVVYCVVQVNVNLNANRRSVNPEIFGVNQADSTHFANVKYPFNRLGGNSMTRYNWEKGIRNAAKDWYFMNEPDDVTSEANLPEGTSVTKFVDTNNQFGSSSMLTASLIGYTPQDVRSKKWSFSQSKYGSQQATECTGTNFASWCTADAGNGVLSSGSNVIGNDPLDAHKVINETYVKNWIKFMKNRGTPVKYWSLDNEPDLWSSTHRDVHPNKLNYDELWNMTVKYGGAIKQQDSSIQTFGPVSWGWCGYFYSPQDGCSTGSDKTNHNNLPLIAFYLKNVCSYKASMGVRLVDYLDIHYYPQASGVDDTYQTVDNNADLRLRTVRSLYDPNYVDESWIISAEPGTRVALIPRMRALIDTYCPGTKLAITEYRFGADNLWSSALAQTEILSVFAREGVDLASKWEVPAAGSFVEGAFKFYLNYDGKGGKVLGDSVNATTDASDQIVTAYAFHNNSMGTLQLVVINKMSSSQSVNVTISSTGYGSVANKLCTIFSFTSASKLTQNTLNVTATATGNVQFTIPSMSAYMVVIPVDTAVIINNGTSPKTSSAVIVNNGTSPKTSSAVNGNPSFLNPFQSVILVVICFVSLTVFTQVLSQ